MQATADEVAEVQAAEVASLKQALEEQRRQVTLTRTLTLALTLALTLPRSPP